MVSKGTVLIQGKLLKGAWFLSLCEVVNQGSSFLRNIILARFLAKEDFGVATMLGMILTLFEMSGKMALSQQIVQSKHGDDASFMASVQFTQLALGALSSALILACAWPLAQYFSGPQYLASIMLLALVPLIGGVNHLDVYRFARRLGFGPQVLSEAIPQLITTLVAWPLAMVFRDYRAVLWILVGRAAAAAIMTHMLAERPFALKLDPKFLRESIAFGLPLLLTGYVQFGNMQGDSIVIAASYPLAQLGEYSVALVMAMAPGLAILRIGSSVSLPLMAEVQSVTPRFVYRYSQYVQGTALVACVALIGMIFCGEHVVVLAFGTKYGGIGTLACWLMVGQSLRVLRGVAITAAMARGDTVNVLVSSIWRLSGLALAVLVGLMKADLTWFAICSFVGEAVALIAAIMHLHTKHGMIPKTTIFPALAALIAVMVAAGVKWGLSTGPYSLMNWIMLSVLSVLTAMMFLKCFSELRSGVGQLVGVLKAKFPTRVLA